MGGNTRLAARQRRRASEPHAGDAISKVLERLVRELLRTSAASGSDTVPSNEALLDVEVDGLRITVFHRAPADANRPRTVLSPREYEVARMVARGYPNKTIASVLEISTWTVSTHLRRIFAKLLESGTLVRSGAAFDPPRA